MMSVILGEEMDSPPYQPKSQSAKRSVACNYCRVKKVRCNGGQPTCANCLDRGERCIYAAWKRRNKRQSYACSDALMEKMARIEAMLTETNNAWPRAPDSEENLQHTMASESLQILSSCRQNQQQQQQTPLSPAHTGHSYQSLQGASPEELEPIPMTITAGDAFRQPIASPSVARDNTDQSSYYEPLPAAQLWHDHYTHTARTIDGDTYHSHHVPDIDRALHNGQKTHMDKSDDDSGYSLENSDWEYHGPGSYLSLCSKAGMDWVAERTGSSEFNPVAEAFTQAMNKPLKLDKKINPERAPEPDRETAWRYVKVYFEKSPDATFDIVNRATFEARLKGHFDNGIAPGQDEDPAWYALRNAIYALGCRFELAQGGYSAHFTQAQAAGWLYFENALSKHSELCFCRTGLLAVQALLCTAVYAEALSCPSIEYMLISAAMRLAQSKGLHRQPGSNWGLSPQDTDHRNWIFWVLYSYEKHVAHRSGRPSIIDDDDISCQIPTRVLPNSCNSLELCTLATKHARLASRITKRCSTAATYCQSTDEVVRNVRELDQQLHEWLDLLPPDTRPGAAFFFPPTLPGDLQTHHILYLHSAYYGSLINIHSIFYYPWSGILGRDRSPTTHEQIKLSTEIVAEAARNIILMTKYISDIYAWTPTWLAFYYPVLGLIILFINILKNPTATTASSDVALIDVVSGHFARMEFASSGQINISFARDLSALARSAIKRAAQKAPTVEAPPTSIVSIDPGLVLYEQLQNEPDSFDYALHNEDNFDLENWSTHLPSFSFNNMMSFNAEGQNDLFV